MTTRALTQPQAIRVNRTRLRQRQSAVLRKAQGRTVVVVTTRNEGEQKCVVDQKYFTELIEKLKAAVETLEITADSKLFQQLLRAAGTVGKDLQRGKLHSFEEAFGQR